MKKFQNHFITYLVVILLLSAACSNEKQSKTSGPQNKLSIEAFVTRNESVENIFRTSGSIIPAEVIVIKPEIGGRVVDLNFSEGSVIQKGQVLVQLDDSELQAELKKFTAQLRMAIDNEKRKNELLSLKGISQAEYDEALSEREVLEANVELTKAHIRNSKIIAPFNGHIGLRYISEGAFLQAGTSIASLAQIDELKIEFVIPEKFASFIHDKLSLNFTVSGNTEIFTAQIYAFEPIIDEQSRTLKVRAKTSNPGNKLFPGAFANVTLNFEPYENTIMIPTQAIVPALNSQNVFVLRNGKMILTKISTGIQTDKQIQITSGLAAGDTVAMTALLTLKNNMPVTISKLVAE